jgi:hypothetical protein
MIKGITVNGKHSYYNFGLRLLKRTIGTAPKDDHTERVPYSNVTHDFSRIYGDPSYGERTLTYTFEFMDFRLEWAEESIFTILEWLHFPGRVILYDDMLPNHHFEVREPTVSHTENHGVYTITVAFKANPAIKPNPNLMYTADTVVLPDINGDGLITATDVSMILAAYAHISAGEDTGLTPEQLKACDANMDGKITAADAALVQAFYVAITAEEYEGTKEGWADFLNDTFNRGKGVI